MSDDLIERVARAIHVHLCRRNVMQYLDNEEDCAGIAQAAIAAIDLPGQREAAARAALEAAAHEGDKYAAWHNQHDDGLSGFDHMALGASEVTDVIRTIDPAAFRGADDATSE